MNQKLPFQSLVLCLTLAIRILICPDFVVAWQGAANDELMESARPNVIIIYADDLGFGDVSCYMEEGNIEEQARNLTPNIDRLAEEGLKFTDAHATAATCTPSRYTLLTGSYAFRNPRARILRGDAQMIIPTSTSTLASVFQSNGYETAVVGKWHLGLGDGRLDWNEPIRPGPAEIGFDYHFLIPATGDRVPCVYVEQGHVVGLDPADPITTSYGEKIGSEPTGKDVPEQLKQKWSHGHNATIVNGISRIGFMTGGVAARWVDEDMADVIVGKANQFIEANRQQPFLLFFSTHDIHVPRVPHSRFAGKSGMGPRGDAIVQLDFCVGSILDTLDRLGLAENTLVLFSSDNGPVLDDGYIDDANEKLGGHRPAGPLRAGKYSLFEGGTRVPTLARYPGRIEPGTTSGALVGQVDWARSLAHLIGAEISTDDFPDSRDQMSALLGHDQVGRPHLVHEAGRLALRVGQWKYIPAGRIRDGLGPWTNDQSGQPGLLFDLDADIGEARNLADSAQDDERRQRLAEMQQLLDKIKSGPDNGLGG